MSIFSVGKGRIAVYLQKLLEFFPKGIDLKLSKYINGVVDIADLVKRSSVINIFSANVTSAGNVDLWVCPENQVFEVLGVALVHTGVFTLSDFNYVDPEGAGAYFFSLVHGVGLDTMYVMFAQPVRMSEKQQLKCTIDAWTSVGVLTVKLLVNQVVS